MITRYLGLCPYPEVFQAMLAFTASRTTTTPDEVWLCEHPSVFTQGRFGTAEHILNPHHIPVVATDRGGQVTYHGPGQLVAYFMIDLKRQKLGIRHLVFLLEETIIKILADFGLAAQRRDGMPGIYIGHDKICSLGLRVKQGCTYHGLALNVDVDLTPFSYIYPCGYRDLIMIRLSDFVAGATVAKVSAVFSQILPWLRNAMYGETYPKSLQPSACNPVHVPI